MAGGSVQREGDSRMNFRRILVLAAFVAVASAAVGAQTVKAGSPFEPPMLENFRKSPVRSTAEFVGRAVLYEYFTTGDQQCVLSIPQINRLHRKYAREGLQVLGVSFEPPGLVDSWAEEKGIEHPYAFDPDKRFLRMCGMPRVPFAVLVDGSGKVAFIGEASRVTDERIQQISAVALKVPVSELPEKFDPVKRALAETDYGPAMKALMAILAEKDPPIEAKMLRDGMQILLDGSFRAADRIASFGDWQGAKAAYLKLQKSCVGLVEEKLARDRLLNLGNNPAAQKGMRQQRELEELRELPASTDDEKKKRSARVDQWLSENAGSYAAKQALEYRKAGKL